MLSQVGPKELEMRAGAPGGAAPDFGRDVLLRSIEIGVCVILCPVLQELS